MHCELSHVKRARLLSQNQIRTVEDWTHVTIGTGLAAIPRKGNVACFQLMACREWWCSNVSSVMWGFLWTEIISQVTTQKTTYKIFCLSSVRTVEASTTMCVKEHGYLQVFLRNLSSPLGIKDITAFLRHSEQCLFPSPTKCFLFHKFIPLRSWNIEVLRKARAKFKCPTE
jgi:hypothetical protein